MYKHLYSRFLAAQSDWLHFAAHSHYFWPDISRDAHTQYWDDSARLVDNKWQHVLGDVTATAQKHISERLNTAAPGQIVFAPNTHELVTRVLSCFSMRQRIKILTTDSEFHSFDRQVRRLIDLDLAEVKFVASEPFETLEKRLTTQLHNDRFDLLYLSTIFFNSGLGIRNINQVVRLASDRCKAIVLDGYHSFCATPIDLSEIQDEVFFVAGGYKYAQSGEGVCFMRVPRKTDLVPANTGWYAGFGSLESGSNKEVGFANDGQRFAGSTYDPSGIYRMNSVFKMFAQNHLDQETIHEYMTGLQSTFLEHVAKLDEGPLRLENLVAAKDMIRGHFFAFELGSDREATDYARYLQSKKILIDVRGQRVRFGFGLYQDADDIGELFQRIQN